MRLKKHESPRKQGRNHKGRGNPKRARQKRKQLQQLKCKLKAGRNGWPLLFWVP